MEERLTSDPFASAEPSRAAPRRLTEDLIAILIGGALLGVCLLGVVIRWSQTGTATNPWQPYLAQPGTWTDNPWEGLRDPLTGVLGAGLATLVAFACAARLSGNLAAGFVKGYSAVFGLATLAFVLAGQTVVHHYGLEYALWALLLGLLVSNVVGAPPSWRQAASTELYMKTGLVLLGAEVLFGKLLALGLPGVCIAWVVTPIVLITTFWFGQRVLKIASPSLNMVISADMSVCGVSAAIATAAACKAKKEELSLAIGLSLTFTVIMMVVMPPVIGLLDLGPIVGGAWIGGTIDSTGAVGAAGSMLGDDALVVATTVKMIQNILIGVVAFAVAVYWVTRVERTPDQRPGAGEIWRRFPKFILGFLAASVVFSTLNELHPEGAEMVKASISGGSKTLRNWCFCLAFVSIGLETRFAELRQYLQGGKPLILYVAGQSLNLCLTLLMSWLMFHWAFPEAVDALAH